MAVLLGAPNSSSGVSSRQSVRSSHSRGTCEQDTLPRLLYPLDGTVSCRLVVLVFVVHIKKKKHFKIVGFAPVFLVHMARTLVYRFPR